MRKALPVLKEILTLSMLLLIVFSGLAQPRLVPLAYDSAIPLNHVRSWQLQAPLTDPNRITTATAVDSATMTTQYLDGLGRPLQTVVKGGSPKKADLVTPVLYDEFGREQFTYLPFTATQLAGAGGSISDGSFKYNAFQQQSQFMQTTYGPQGETYFYGQTVYEPSPLNRVTERFAPGNNWVGTAGGVNEATHRSVKTKYWINTALDSVKTWKVTNGATGTFGSYTKTGDYPAGQLYKTVTVDEQNKQVIEFKDKEGQVILKKVQLTAIADEGSGRGHSGWLCTYYLYDDLNQLRAVFPPKAVELMAGTNNWTLDATAVSELCFRYEYDERGRMIMKKVPGAGAVYMVYDARDRLVMSQDTNMRVEANAKWLVTRYDALNRPIETGLLTMLTTNPTFTYHLAQAKGSTDYPNTTGSNYELLTQSGYDNYLSLPSGCPSAVLDETGFSGAFYMSSYTSADFAEKIVQSEQTTGMLTWTKVKVLGSAPAKYLYTVNLYDEKGRVTQVKSTNYTGATDITTTQYNFAGRVFRTVLNHRKAGTNARLYTLRTDYSYDHMGRVRYIVKRPSVDGYSIANRIPASYSYNESGQISSNQLGLVPNATPPAPPPMETLTYQYNIRGWLLGVNRDYAKSISSTTNYFGFDLGYDRIDVKAKGESSIGSYAQGAYNGNITGMVWKSTGDDEIRKYDFSYDGVNRLTGAAFNQYTSGSFNTTAGIDYSVSGLSYDGNGNILGMTQKGWKLGGSSTPIDQLSYTYLANSNKLQAVSDAYNDKDSKLGDFKYNPATKTTTDYGYDGNGNLISDKNKDITSIAYNYLNLPQLITVSGKGTIAYVYDAGGNKLQKIVQETGKPDQSTLYMAGAVYQNDTLQFISHEEGRIRYKSKAGQNSYVYDYFLKDHLGNVRMVLTEDHQSDAYPAATMETATATAEEALYSNMTNTRVDKPSTYPYDPYLDPNAKVAKVRGDGQKIGPGIMLKVMAGDKFNLRVSSYYNLNGTTPSAPNSIVNDLITMLNYGASTVVGGKATLQELQNTNVFSPGATQFFNSHSGYTASKPKAFVNWVLYNEQFQYVGSSSGFEQVGGDNALTNHVKNGLPISKNGYLYVYLSNETPNIDVFFDNLQVTHTHGPLLEENHYYPFGLVQAGISSKAFNFGGAENKQLYLGNELQNKEFSDGNGLELYDMNARQYDQQLGRFHGQDALSEKFYQWSPYSYSFNNPIKFYDPTGLAPFGDYYTKDGKYLGWDGKNDGRLYVANEYRYDSKSGKSIITNKTELKGVSNELMLGFASLIHAESSGNKEESYAIGNVTMNFISEGGSSQLKTLEDVAMYDNTFAQGATQEHFSEFIALGTEGRNSKYAIGAAINAIGHSQGLEGFSDYSNGADSWDGIDLISTKWTNSHRSYTWSTDSKGLLTEYKTKYNGGVDVSGFTYKSAGYQISATKIIGKTLYTNLATGRGEIKQSGVRFDYRK